MIGSTRAVRVYAYSEPVDLRKSYNSLEGIVRNQLGHDLLRGDLYLEGSELVARDTLSPPALRLKDFARFDRS